MDTLLNSYFIKVAYCFLPRKTIGNYKDMWTQLKHLCLNMLQKLPVFTTFVSDFELSAHVSVKINFPGCKIKIVCNN